jgi:predicted aspartyl protease
MTPPSNPTLHPVAFTNSFNGRSLRLTTPIEIFPAFDPATTKPTQGKRYEALYDTGATHSAISPQVVADLNLASIGARTVGVVGGSLTTTSHLVNIGLPNKVMFGMITVAKTALLGGVDALIGMDILGMGDFAVTHHEGKTVFSFCVPSRRKIDFVDEIDQFMKQKSIPAISHKLSRNSPCHCGSRKKYKVCHGR